LPDQRVKNITRNRREDIPVLMIIPDETVKDLPVAAMAKYMPYRRITGEMKLTL
jgi:hypothetical protein